MSDLIFRGMRIFSQEAFGLHQHTGGTKSTLKSPMIQKRLLQRVQLVMGCHPLDLS